MQTLAGAIGKTDTSTVKKGKGKKRKGGDVDQGSGASKQAGSYG